MIASLSYRYCLKCCLVLAGIFPFMEGVAEGPPTVLPGGSHNFREVGTLRVIPDAISADTSFIPLRGFAAASDVSVPMSTFVHAYGGLGSSHASVLQYNDFILKSGPDSDRLLTAQFSGNVNVRGFMLLVGQGQLDASVSIQILDVTGRSGDGYVIASYPVYSESVTNAVGLGVGGAIEGILGSASVVQVGADLSFSLGVTVERRLIRENVDFGFSALLRRGHQYRIQVVSSSNGAIGVLGGRGIASFYSPLAPIPNGISDPLLLSIPAPLLDPLEWLDEVDIPFLDKDLPSIDIPSSIFNFTSPAKTLTLAGWGSEYSIKSPSKGVNIAPKFPVPFRPGNNTNDILQEFGLETNLKDILINNLDKPLPEEIFALPGVELRNLSVDVEDDMYEEFAALHAEIAELKSLMLEQPFYNNPKRGN